MAPCCRRRPSGSRAHSAGAAAGPPPHGPCPAAPRGQRGPAAPAHLLTPAAATGPERGRGGAARACAQRAACSWRAAQMAVPGGAPAGRIAAARSPRRRLLRDADAFVSNRASGRASGQAGCPAASRTCCKRPGWAPAPVRGGREGQCGLPAAPSAPAASRGRRGVAGVGRGVDGAVGAVSVAALGSIANLLWATAAPVKRFAGDRDLRPPRLRRARPQPTAPSRAAVFGGAGLPGHARWCGRGRVEGPPGAGRRRICLARARARAPGACPARGGAATARRPAGAAARSSASGVEGPPGFGAGRRRGAQGAKEKAVQSGAAARAAVAASVVVANLLPRGAGGRVGGWAGGRRVGGWAGGRRAGAVHGAPAQPGWGRPAPALPPPRPLRPPRRPLAPCGGAPR
jgi:hypothetical protein